jgi:hypothetical protein
MGEFEVRIKNATVRINPWCRVCPDFKDMIVHAERYGSTVDGIAVLALRMCTQPPKEHPTHHTDGTELEYWETRLPKCQLGERKLEVDAEMYEQKHGLSIISLADHKKPKKQ